MVEQEPPSSKSNLFFVGKDSRGNWVVQDQQHRCGGLFVDRAEALRFALFENGRERQAIVIVPGTFELDLSGNASTRHVPPAAAIPLQRRAA